MRKLTINSVRRNDCSQLINCNDWPKLQDLNGLSLYSGGGVQEELKMYFECAKILIEAHQRGVVVGHALNTTKGVSASPNFLRKMFFGPRADKINKKNVALHCTAGIKSPFPI
jgi:hypothetical protein